MTRPGEAEVSSDGATEQTGDDAVSLLLARLILPIAIAVFLIDYYRSIADLSAQSRVYPQALIAVLGLFVISEIVIACVARVKSGSPTPGSFFQACARWKRTLLVSLLTVALVPAVALIGFYVPAAIWLALILAVLRVRSPLVIAFYVLAALGATYLVFERMLGMTLS